MPKPTIVLFLLFFAQIFPAFTSCLIAQESATSPTGGEESEVAEAPKPETLDELIDKWMEGPTKVVTSVIFYKVELPEVPFVLIWLIVGDLEQIEQQIRDLELGDVQIIDEDGKPIPASD